MCGLAAIVGDGDAGSIGSMETMLAQLSHRGPDGHGMHVAGRKHGEPNSFANDSLGEGVSAAAGPLRAPVMLGHRRLAIMDPAGGSQPLVEPPDIPGPGRLAAVCNGMIYNFQDLRDELGADRFVTGSDSEVVLHGSRLLGAEALASRLDGMFAFVVSDGRRVVAARDLIGIKPLYIGRRSNGGRTATDRPTTYFASEIKALLPVADEIAVVPPGHLFDSSRGDWLEAIRPYRSVPEPADDDRDDATRIAEVRQVVEASVVKRLQSDVPLGCFLSGGLDSSIVAALAKRHQGTLHTFAVGLEGSSDLAAARLMAEHLGTIHHEHRITPEEIRRDLPEILGHLESFDRDLVRSAIPCWYVSQLAREHVKVVLTGEGADELFAGYTYHRDYGATPELSGELHRSILAMHSVNLQRVDRITMAQGLEARVPFLDAALIALAMRIDPSRKLRLVDGRRIDKWVLRSAFADLLPEAVAWRKKLQFDQGTGLSELMVEVAADWAAHRGIDDRTPLVDGRMPRDLEEAVYAELMAEQLGEDHRLFGLVDRWADGRLAQSAVRTTVKTTSAASMAKSKRKGSRPTPRSTAAVARSSA